MLLFLIILFHPFFSDATGRFAGGGHGQMFQMVIMFGLPIFGQHTPAGFLDGLYILTFRKQHYHLTKFLILLSAHHKGCCQNTTQFFFHLFYLNFQAPRADYVVFSSKDSKSITVDFYPIVGHEGSVMNEWSVYDQTSLGSLADADMAERLIPLGRPNSMRKVL